MSPYTFTPLPAADVNRVDAAVAEVVRRPRGCAHLSSTRPGFLCLLHPGTLRCLACSLRHTKTHTDGEEHTCDVCTGPLDGGDGSRHLGLMQPVDVDLKVRQGRGHVTRVRRVVVIGWGCCSGCYVDPNAARWFGEVAR